MLQVQPNRLELRLNLREGLLFLLLGLVFMDLKQWLLHSDPANVRSLSDGRSLVVFGHLDHKELLVGYTRDPQLSNQMAMLDFEVVARRPGLTSVAERPNNAESIVAEKLALLTVAEPSERA